MDEPIFPTLYSAKNETEKNRRENKFVLPIRDEGLLQKVTQLHKIFHACRTYLRVFDAECSYASEVYEARRILEDRRHNLPFEAFPNNRRENLKFLKDVFQKIKKEPFLGFKKARVTPLSDLHYAAALLDPFRTPLESEPDFTEAMNSLRKHLDNYYLGFGHDMEDVTLRGLKEKIILYYFKARNAWRRTGTIRTLSRISAPSHGGKDREEQSPIYWWQSGGIMRYNGTRGPIRPQGTVGAKRVCSSNSLSTSHCDSYGA